MVVVFSHENLKSLVVQHMLTDIASVRVLPFHPESPFHSSFLAQIEHLCSLLIKQNISLSLASALSQALFQYIPSFSFSFFSLVPISMLLSSMTIISYLNCWIFSNLVSTFTIKHALFNINFAVFSFLDNLQYLFKTQSSYNIDLCFFPIHLQAFLCPPSPSPSLSQSPSPSPSTSLCLSLPHLVLPLLWYPCFCTGVSSTTWTQWHPINLPKAVPLDLSNSLSGTIYLWPVLKVSWVLTESHPP